MTNPAEPAAELTLSRRTLNTLSRVRTLFAHLHDQGCDRDQAKNRKLHFDDLLSLVMVALFQPLALSHRALTQISDLKQVRKRFAVRHAAAGSISEAARVFDPTPLRLVVAELIRHQPPGPNDSRLAPLHRRLAAVDGTLLDALPRLIESAWGHHRDGSPQHRWRLHQELDIQDSFPTGSTGPDRSTPGPATRRPS